MTDCGELRLWWAVLYKLGAAFASMVGHMIPMVDGEMCRAGLSAMSGTFWD